MKRPCLCSPYWLHFSLGHKLFLDSFTHSSLNSQGSPFPSLLGPKPDSSPLVIISNLLPKLVDYLYCLFSLVLCFPYHCPYPRYHKSMAWWALSDRHCAWFQKHNSISNEDSPCSRGPYNLMAEGNNLVNDWVYNCTFCYMLWRK